MFFLGVDGGGTKTAFVLINKNGETVFRYTTTSAHIAQIQKQGLIRLFEEFFTELDKKGLNKDDIEYSFLGMPGYTESALWDTQIEEVLASYFKDKHTCGNDAVAGWAGSLACNVGINLVAGTGTICFGIDDHQNSARSGGWGHLIGDEASGFWLGKQVLEIFTKQSDGRELKSPLYTIFKDTVKLQNDNDLIDIVYNRWLGSRDKIADLSKIAYVALLEGDTNAKELIELCAKEMASMVHAVAKKLEFSNTIEVSYSGGVFKMGEHILPIFTKYLNQNSDNLQFSIKQPIFEPDKGSALYAAKLGGVDISNKFLENLLK